MIAAILTRTAAGAEIIVAAYSPNASDHECSFTVDDVTVAVSITHLPGPITRVIAFGQDGNDNLAVAGSVIQPVELYAGSGHDRVKGGSGADVLIGGS